jgi:hypothetical protein
VLIILGGFVKKKGGDKMGLISIIIGIVFSAIGDFLQDIAKGKYK